MIRVPFAAECDEHVFSMLDISNCLQSLRSRGSSSHASQRPRLVQAGDPVSKDFWPSADVGGA